VEVDMAEANEDKAETVQAEAGSLKAKTFYCTFCFKSQHQVKMLISSPAAIFICDECVALCNECIAGLFPNKSKLPSDKDLPTERLLERLPNRRHVARQG
jgi:hypothetical protein